MYGMSYLTPIDLTNNEDEEKIKTCKTEETDETEDLNPIDLTGEEEEWRRRRRKEDEEIVKRNQDKETAGAEALTQLRKTKFS